MQILQTAKSNHTTLSYRPEIDGLRAIAVLAVVIYHGAIPGAPGGFAGVDIFFVISGFLITQLLLKELERTGGISILKFYERRVRRLLPALYAMLLVTSMAVLIFYAPGDLLNFGQSLAAALVFASNIYFWRSSGYFSQDAEVAPLLHTWSLAVEEQFYMFWPLLILAAFWIFTRLKQSHQTQKLFILTVVCFFISLGLSAWGSTNFPQPSFYLVPTRAFELLLGAMIGMRPLPILSKLVEDFAVALGLFLIVSFVLLIDSAKAWPGLWALWPCVGTALIIWGGAHSRLAKLVLANRVIVGIGLISYSWYLWHWPAFAIYKYVTFRDPFIWESALIIIGSLLCAYLFWAILEQPIRRKKKSSPWRTFAILGVTPALAFMVLFAVIQSTDGLPIRVDPAVAELSRAASTISPIRRDCHQVMRDRGALPEAGSCTLGEGSRKALLWGDSHANHYGPALIALTESEDMSVRQVSKSGCPALLDVSHIAELPLFEGDCEAFNSNVRDLIASDSSISDIWIAAFWRSNLMALDGNISALTANLSRTIKALEDQGRNVYVLGAAPNFRFEASDCAVRQAQFRFAKIKCSLDESEYQAVMALDAALASVAGERYFKLTDLLCNDKNCNVTYQGRPVFLDSHHLNADFSTWLGRNSLREWFRNQ